MKRTAAVIGCGIVGASVALELARRGWRVHVLDRESGPGAGSTRLSASVVRCTYTHPEGIKLAWEGLRVWQNWADHLGLTKTRAWYRPVGVLFIYDPKTAHESRAGVLGVKPEMSAGELKTRTAMMKRHGVRIELLQAKDLRKRFPGLEWSREQAIYEPDSGYVVYPTQAVEDVVEAARRHGAEFAFSRTVVGLAEGDRRRRHRVVVESPDGHLDELLADVVVNAAGPHSPGLGLGFRIPLGLNAVPLRQYILRGRYEGRRVPTMADLVHGYYCRPDADVFKIGAVLPRDLREFESTPDGTASGEALEEHGRALLESARRRIPGLELRDSACELAYYDWTVADSYPIIDRTDLDGYYVAAGTSGSWFKGAPVIGMAAAHLIERVEKGADHDGKPVTVKLPRTGHTLDLGAFSRRRAPLG